MPVVGAFEQVLVPVLHIFKFPAVFKPETTVAVEVVDPAALQALLPALFTDLTQAYLVNVPLPV